MLQTMYMYMYVQCVYIHVHTCIYMHIQLQPKVVNTAKSVGMFMCLGMIFPS